MKKTVRIAAGGDAESVLFANIRTLIESARSTVARGVDLVQVHTNFEIGRHIVEFEQQGDQRATYGDALLTLLADRLTAEFGKGFGRSNMAYCRSFYLAYRERGPIVQTHSGRLVSQVGAAPFQIVQTTSGQSERPFSLSGSHYVFLLGIKKADERSFYEIEASSQNWTLRELRRQFQSGLYERLAATSKPMPKPPPLASCCAKRSTRHWWKSPCPKTPTSTPGNTSSICRAKRNCSKSWRSGRGAVIDRSGAPPLVRPTGFKKIAREGLPVAVRLVLVADRFGAT